MFHESLTESATRTKVVHLILNGHPQRLFSHSYTKPLRREDLEGLCDREWGQKFKVARFFTIEGVEILEEELSYVRNGDRIYVSKGQEFDSTRNFGEYQLLRQLGEGGFGRVWLAKSSIDQSLAAIKILKLEKISGARDIDMVFREAETLKGLSHPNIIKILSCFALANMQLVVVMEYLAGGELLGLLKQHNTFSEPMARRLFAQIVQAVSHCHRQGIIHRDLKLQNVLLESKEEMRVKVADFGISGVADTFNPDVDFGTLRYMAPEVLSRKEKNNSAGVDVWACGVMLYCMVCGKLPFSENTTAATTQAIITGHFTFPPRLLVSPDCQHLIRWMLTVDPKSRPMIHEVANHPWVVGTVSLKSVFEDRVVEESLQHRKVATVKQFKKLGDVKKKLPSIPKRLEREKEQVMEELRNLRGSRGRLQLSDSKWRGGGSSPRYMQNIRCKEDDDRGIKRRRSFLTGVWK